MCVSAIESVTTLNSERKRARGDRYAPVCSRWLTKRLVKRLLTAAVTAAASVGGKLPPIGRRSRPTGDDLRPPACTPRAYARNRIITPRDHFSRPRHSTHTSPSDTTSQNDHTARAIVSTASRMVLSAAFLYRRQASPRHIVPRSLLFFPRVYRSSFTVSLFWARTRADLHLVEIPVKYIKFITVPDLMALWEE